MFHSLILSQNAQISEGNVKCKTFFTLKEWVINPCLMYKQIFFLADLFQAYFDHSSLNQMCLYFLSQIFPFMLFSYFYIKILFYEKFKLSIKDYLLLIHTFMGISQDNNLKFQKSPKPHYQRRFGNGVESGMTVLQQGRRY